MKIEDLHVGMKVEHPHYGVGIVKSIGEVSADIRFDEGVRTISPQGSRLQPAEAMVAISGLEMPLKRFLDRAVQTIINELGLEKPDLATDELAARWHGGRMMLHPADASLQAKEVPLETFFHKIVMMRNNLRVLEQKINSNERLTDAEKVEMQQYITRCYGSMTTFNVLFRSKEDQFRSQG